MHRPPKRHPNRICAVTNGSPNNGARPYVGLSVYYDADWNPMWRCSGAMISETVYLTATHE